MVGFGIRVGVMQETGYCSFCGWQGLVQLPGFSGKDCDF